MVFQNPNVIEDRDQSISIRFLGRAGIEYRELSRTMFVDSEMGVDAVAVFRTSLKRWEPPHENDPLSDADRDRVLNNVKTLLESRGQRVDIL